MKFVAPLGILIGFTLASVGLAMPYNSPAPDGCVTVTPEDWDTDEWVVDDPADDCRYFPIDADLDDMYVTWDSEYLYVGITTTNGPGTYGNGYVLYIDTDAQDGITGATDFTNADFYPLRVTLSTMGADVLMGVWSLVIEWMEIKHCTDPTNTTPVEGCIMSVDPAQKHVEIALPWQGVYGLGGEVPAGATLRFIAAVVGVPPECGAYDAMPSTSTGVESSPETPYYSYTDLDIFYEVIVDADGDSIPDDLTTCAEEWSWGRIKGTFSR